MLFRLRDGHTLVVLARRILVHKNHTHIGIFPHVPVCAAVIGLLLYRILHLEYNKRNEVLAICLT